MKGILLIALLTATFAFSGCGLFGKKNTSQPPANAQNPGEVGGSGPETSGAPAGGYPPAPVEIGGAAAAAPLNPDSTGLDALAGGETVVRFEFDSITINAEGMVLVQRFGKYLADNPAARLRLEGHTDERGTREYNVGLGERRANAVQDALIAAGASAAQLGIISYGEERPASPGHDESDWSRNRRVQIVK